MPIIGTGPKRTDGKTNFLINATPYTLLPGNYPKNRTGGPLMGYKFLTYNQVVNNFGLWYDAMDTSTIKDVGGNFPPLLPPNALGVAQWNDKSGNNNNLTNTGIIGFNLLGNNFYPLLYPNNAFAVLKKNINPNPTFTGCNISAFFVLTASNVGGGAPLLAFTSSFNSLPAPATGNQLLVNTNSTFDFTLVCTSSNIGLSRFGYASSNNVVQAPYFGSTALIELQINGTQTTIGNVLPSTNTISINGSFISSSSFYAGNNFNFQYLSLFGGFNFACNISMSLNEVGIFYRTLTTPERVAYETQLIKKWALPSNAPVTYINSLPVSSGLFGWYDAYDQTTVLRNTTNNVSMWLDKSGQSNHMSTNLLTFGSNTGSNIYYSSIGISTNQFPCLYFPSTFAFMQTSTLITNQNLSSMTLIAVKRGTKIPTVQPRTVAVFSTLNALELGGGTIGATNDLIYNNGNINTQFTSNYSTFHINTLQGNVGPVAENGVASGTSVTYYNGANAQTASGIVYNGNFYPSYMRLMNGPWNDQANGDSIADSGYLSEVLIYNRILNSTELTNTHKYLLNKWGISTTQSNVPVTSGLNLWLDSYDPSCVITDSNSNVLLWRDKSLSNLNFSNNGLSVNLKYPIFKNNPVNNLPGLFFSNNAPTNTYYTGIYNCNFNYPVTTEATIFSVFQTSPGNFSYYNPIFTMLSNNEIIYNTGNGFSLITQANGILLTMARSTISWGAIPISINTPVLASAVFNSSFSTTVIADIPQNYLGLGKNGVIGFTTISSFVSSINNVSTLKFNVNQAVIGLRSPGGGDAQWFHSGYVHEVLLYNRALSFPERQQVESYLMSKWKI